MPYPTIVAEGNLVDDIELKFYNEKACANFRIACNSRKKTETGEWVNTDPIYLSGSIWGKAAENTANTFSKGDPIIITGELKQRSYTNKEGINKTVDEINANTIAAPIKKF